MQNTPQPPYGPVEPRSAEILEAELGLTGELINAVRGEKAEIANLSTGDQARLAGHMALLDQDETEVAKMQSDTFGEATVRDNIDRNRREAKVARLAEMRAEREARRELDQRDPLVPDPQTGQPIRQSELAEANRSGDKDSSGRRH